MGHAAYLAQTTDTTRTRRSCNTRGTSEDSGSSYLKMKYVLALLSLVAALTTVRGVSQCIKAMECNEVFAREASRKGIDEGIFCWYIRQKIDCLVNVKGSCSPEQKEWVQNDIDTAKGKYPNCDSASFLKSSVITSILLVLLAVFIRP